MHTMPPPSPKESVVASPAASAARARPASLNIAALGSPLLSPLHSKRFGRRTPGPSARVWMLAGALLLALSALLAARAPSGAAGAALRTVGLQTVSEVGGEDEAPPDRRALGRASWTAVHTLAANFPDKPSREEMESAKAFVQALAGLYPCKLCRYHFDRYVSVRPPDVSSRERFLLWTCEAHNEVSRRNRKPVFPCELAKLDKRWSDCGCH